MTLPFLERLSSGKGLKLAVAVGLCGMVLILLSGWLPRSQTKTSLPTPSDSDTEDYAHRLEERLETLLSHMQGVGKCDVLITLAGGKEYIYATEEKSTTKRSEDSDSGNRSVDEQDTGEQEYIILKTDGGEQALIITELAPRIGGVVVVCDGGANGSVAQRVAQAVGVALDIPSAKVCVTTRQSS